MMHVKKERETQFIGNILLLFPTVSKSVLNFFQVLAFREQKLEALKLQAVIAAKQQVEEEEQLRAAEERERKCRDKKHRQV